MQCILSTIESKMNATDSRLTDLALVSQKTTNDTQLQTDNEYSLLFVKDCIGHRRLF